MNKEVLDSILPTMDTNDIVELVHNHLCGLRVIENKGREDIKVCLLYTSPSPRDSTLSRMPSSA